MIVEGDNLLLKQIVETMFGSELANKEIHLTSITISDSDKFLRILQHARNVDLIFSAALGETNVSDIDRFAKMARWGFARQDRIIGISEYSKYKEILINAGCALAYTPVEA